MVASPLQRRATAHHPGRASSSSSGTVASGEISLLTWCIVHFGVEIWGRKAMGGGAERAPERDALPLALPATWFPHLGIIQLHLRTKAP